LRKLTEFSDSKQVLVFSSYLVSLGIQNQVDEANDTWEVWVFDDTHLEDAKNELDFFLKDPEDARFNKIEKIAQKIKQEEEDNQKKLNKLYVDTRLSPQRSQSIQVTWMLIGISVAVFFLREYSNSEFAIEVLEKFFITDSARSPFLSKVLEGEIWRLATPMFLHFTWLHIIFNMMWLHTLGSIIEQKKGGIKYLLIIFTIAVLSNLVQYLMQYIFVSPNFGGMSGVVFGLVGYVWMKMKFSPHEGIGLDPMNINIMLIWLVVCMTGLVGPIANGAHLGGLVVGLILGYVPYFIKVKLKKR